MTFFDIKAVKVCSILVNYNSDLAQLMDGVRFGSKFAGRALLHSPDTSFKTLRMTVVFLETI